MDLIWDAYPNTTLYEVNYENPNTSRQVQHKTRETQYSFLNINESSPIWFRVIVAELGGVAYKGELIKNDGLLILNVTVNGTYNYLM